LRFSAWGPPPPPPALRCARRAVPLPPLLPQWGREMLIRPSSVEELERLIVSAAAEGRKLELRGGGTKAEVGGPREAGIIDMTGFSGILDYDPAELVMTVQAGTPLHDVEAAVAERNQMLAF